MPCFTQQTSVVQFSANTDLALLKKALEGLGFTVREIQGGLSFNRASMGQSGTFVNGEMRVTSSMQEDMNVFKRAYSAEVVKAASARFGWQVKKTAANKFQVTRRA